jgi:hypothetical protein
MLPKGIEPVFDEETNWLCFPPFGLLNVSVADNRHRMEHPSTPLLVSSMERLAPILNGKVDPLATILPHIGHP